MENENKELVERIEDQGREYDELQAEVAETLPKGVKTVFFSSVAQQGLMELKDLIWQQLNA